MAFEQITTASGANAVRVGVANLTMSLGGGAVTISDGTGALFLTSGVPGESSLAAQISATIGVSIPGVSLSGTLGLAINTGTAGVNETFMVGTTPVDVVLPPGQFLQVSGTDVEIVIAGQRIAGDFTITQTTDTAGASTLRITRWIGSNRLPAA